MKSEIYPVNQGKYMAISITRGLWKDKRKFWHAKDGRGIRDTETKEKQVMILLKCLK